MVYGRFQKYKEMLVVSHTQIYDRPKADELSQNDIVGLMPLRRNPAGIDQARNPTGQVMADLTQRDC
jgi:hypothetical protein